MKRICILLAILSWALVKSYAQDSTYLEINKQICSCLTQKSKGPMGIEEYHDCTIQSLQKHMASLLADMKKKNGGDSTNLYQQGLSYGKMMGSGLDTDLVYTCDVYFKIADTLRAGAFRTNNPDSLRQQLVYLNNPVNVRDFQFYRRRSVTYFLLGMVDQAYLDDEEVLKQEPANIGGLLIRAFYLENHASYAEAASIFYQLDKMTGDHAYLVSAAINNRKNSELYHQ